MARLRDPLLGRRAETDVLKRELAETRRGHSSFVVVSGEAGIGKTRLLEELTAMADEDGFLTLRGRGLELDGQRPFGAFADALDAYLASLDAHDLDRLETDRLGALAAVFPSLQRLDRAMEYPTTVTERFRSHHAVRELLERLSARRPLLLVLDDLHWADGASLELTSYLLRNPPEGEVMVAIAMRPVQRGASIGALGQLHGMSHVSHLELRPLDVASVAELIGEADGVDLAELVRLSGGNPFYALQLARAGIGRPEKVRGGLEVPAPVAGAIAVELAGLPDSTRAVAEAAAVAGDPFDIDLAVAASGLPEGDILQEIDVLLSRDLLRETDVPRRFQFRHPIVHRAVYGACPPSMKVSCHRRVVSALSGRGVSAAALAGHVEQSARYGDAEAVSILSRAAAEAEENAPTSAVRWLSAALRIVPAEAVVQRVELLTRLANSEAALGRFATAHEVLDECLELSSGLGDTPVELIVRCAEIEQLLGRHSDSRARLEKAYDDLGDPSSAAAVSLLIALTAASLYLSDYGRMLEWGGLAVAAAEMLGDQPLLAAALAAHTMGAAFAGQESLAVGQHDQCALLVDSLADDVIVSRLDSLSNLTMAEIYLDRHVLACAHGLRALELARATGQTHLLPTLTPILGSSLALAGEMQRSLEVLDDAIEAARLVGDAQGLCMNLFNRELSAVMAGDIDGALGVGLESLQLAHSVDNGVITAFAGAIHSQALLESGDAPAALDLLVESVGGEDVPLLAGSWRAHFLELLTRCSLAVGDLGRANAAAARLRQQADEHGMGLTILMADRADAEVALAEGRNREAVQSALSSVVEAERIAARAHAPVSRALLGEALVAAGAREEAIEQLRLAAGEFDALGAGRYRDRVEARLRGLGEATTHRRRAMPGDGATGVGALTGRELEVAELVLDRRTNREIAEELFLSTKTVETHMRNIFNKLGVSSRVEVARALVRARLPD